MKKKHLGLAVAAEAIAHQGKSKLFQELVELIRTFKESGKYDNEEAARLKISDMIEKHTGISVQISVVPHPFYGLAVEPPDLDPNNAIWQNAVRPFLKGADLNRVTKALGGSFEGVIDKRDCMVYGAFAALICPLYITTATLSDVKYEAEKIAAGILHELGHIWSYFERLIDLVSANLVMQAASENIMKTDDMVQRVKLIAETEKYLGVEIPNKETIAETTKQGVLYTHLVCESIKNRRNVEGDEIYSKRGFEFSSDQFAVRHGAGAHLAGALDLIERSSFFNSSYMSWPTHIAVQIVSFVTTLVGHGALAIATSGMSILLSAIVLMAAKPTDKIYDDPKERFNRIENEIRSELKDKSITDARRKEVLEDLETVKRLSEDVEDKMSWLEAVWLYLIPVGRKANKSKEFQQSLEALANNELYEASALLHK